MRTLPRVLIVEDEAPIAELIAVNLRHNGFQPTWAMDSETAQRELDAVLPDVILLDWMLPGESGLSLAKKWRKDPRTKGVPILMLTARGDEADRVAGLDAGADDYITKPFSPKELVARVRALLRRLERIVPTAGHLTYGPLAIDLDRHVVTVDGQETRLTAKEFLLLQYLMTHRGRVLSRDLLLSDVWDYSYTGGTRTVDVHVRRLREKLPFLVDALVTVKQFGYKLLEPAPVVAPPAASRT